MYFVIYLIKAFLDGQMSKDKSTPLVEMKNTDVSFDVAGYQIFYK